MSLLGGYFFFYFGVFFGTFWGFSGDFFGENLGWIKNIFGLGSQIMEEKKKDLEMENGIWGSFLEDFLGFLGWNYTDFWGIL